MATNVNLINIPVSDFIVRQMKINRNAINDSWSLSQYLEHIVALHTEVIKRKEDI